MATRTAGDLTAAPVLTARAVRRAFGADASCSTASTSTIARRRVRGPARRQRLRQEHPAARSSPASTATRPASRAPCTAPPPWSSRSTGCCPGSGSRTTSPSACAARTPATGSARRWPRSGSPTGTAPGRPSCPAGRRSGSRWPARWSASRDLLLLDEPFGALDALTRLRMQALLRRLRAEHGFAALLVTHDVDEALLLADRILLLDDGRIAAELPVDLGPTRTPGRPGLRRAAPPPARPPRRAGRRPRRRPRTGRSSPRRSVNGPRPHPADPGGAGAARADPGRPAGSRVTPPPGPPRRPRGVAAPVVQQRRAVLGVPSSPARPSTMAWSPTVTRSHHPAQQPGQHAVEDRHAVRPGAPAGSGGEPVDAAGGEGRASSCWPWASRCTATCSGRATVGQLDEPRFRQNETIGGVQRHRGERGGGEADRRRAGGGDHGDGAGLVAQHRGARRRRPPTRPPGRPATVGRGGRCRTAR